MSERVQSFGGEHTRKKLDVVAKYLAAYATVMKKQEFRLFYVDGFAGSGASTSKIWGSGAWRTKAVRPADTSSDLFGAVDERLEKIARAKQFSEMFRDHLQDVFAGGVANAYLPLGRGRRHDFSLMFACANPRPAASEKAMRIANHILRTA